MNDFSSHPKGEAGIGQWSKLLRLIWSSSTARSFVQHHRVSQIRLELEISSVTVRVTSKKLIQDKMFCIRMLHLDCIWNRLPRKDNMLIKHVKRKTPQTVLKIPKLKGQFWTNKKLGLVPDVIFSCVLCLESLYPNSVFKLGPEDTVPFQEQCLTLDEHKNT